MIHYLRAMEAAATYLSQTHYGRFLQWAERNDEYFAKQENLLHRIRWQTETGKCPK